MCGRGYPFHPARGCHYKLPRLPALFWNIQNYKYYQLLLSINYCAISLIINELEGGGGEEGISDIKN